MYTGASRANTPINYHTPKINYETRTEATLFSPNYYVLSWRLLQCQRPCRVVTYNAAPAVTVTLTGDGEGMAGASERAAGKQGVRGASNGNELGYTARESTRPEGKIYGVMDGVSRYRKHRGHFKGVD